MDAVTGTVQGGRKMRGTDTLFSQKSDEWSTPKDFYEKIDAEFHFTLDPCATEENHKTETYFTIKDNGLSKSWGGTACFVIRLTA